MSIRFYKIIFLFFGIITSISCGDKSDERLTFFNNSKITISLYEARNYPDTLQLDASYYSAIAEITPYTFKKLPMKGDWIGYINSLPNGTIMFYVIDYDSSEKYNSFQYIVQNNKLEKRYDLTVNDLNKMNWTITYP